MEVLQHIVSETQKLPVEVFAARDRITNIFRTGLDPCLYRKEKAIIIHSSDILLLNQLITNQERSLVC